MDLTRGVVFFFNPIAPPVCLLFCSSCGWNFLSLHRIYRPREVEYVGHARWPPSLLFYNTHVQDCRAGTASPRSSAEFVPSQVHLMASGKGRVGEDTTDRFLNCPWQVTLIARLMSPLCYFYFALQWIQSLWAYPASWIDFYFFFLAAVRQFPNAYMMYD